MHLRRPPPCPTPPRQAKAQKRPDVSVTINWLMTNKVIIGDLCCFDMFFQLICSSDMIYTSEVGKICNLHVLIKLLIGRG